ncbi:MAG: hypothetical protein US69_C0006G0021 [candidate division TM6 bacterium GW2011_GWF2_38_10]|nr:MAG: hypothetical protein US69_C0006G0021 [candidate division TM6 bacterium GW2011_GWF2_38_10]
MWCGCVAPATATTVLPEIASTQNAFKPLELSTFLPLVFSKHYNHNYVCTASLMFYFPTSTHKKFYLQEKAPIITPKNILFYTLATSKFLMNSINKQRCNQNPNATAQHLLHNQNGIYIQSLIVPQNTIIIGIGDLHGNLHTLASIIRKMQKKQLIDEQGIIKDNVRIVITGDVSDRGHFSLETWALLLMLFHKNPQKVIILQGNHENRQCFLQSSFYHELCRKYYHLNDQILNMISKSFQDLFSLLPQVVFIGAPNNNGIVDFLQFNHGGLPTNVNESFYTPIAHFLCTTTTSNPTYPTSYLVLPSYPKINGLIWNGYFADEQDIPFQINGFRISDTLSNPAQVTNYLQQLKQQNTTYCVSGIIRGHDHLQGGVNQLLRTIITEDVWIQNTLATQRITWEMVDHKESVKITLKDTDLSPVFTLTNSPLISGTDSFAAITFNADSDHNCWILTAYAYPREKYHNDGNNKDWLDADPLKKTTKSPHHQDKQPVQSYSYNCPK